ncbi:O-antigen translocase [Photobacterium damselae]
MLIKSSILNAIAVFVKIVSGFIINKLIAIYVGPSGFAQISQFQNIINIITGVSITGFSSGITKYIAEYGSEDKKSLKIINTSISLVIINSLIVFFVLIFFGRNISLFFLNDSSFKYYFYLLGCTILLFCFNGIFLAIINGESDYKTYFYVNLLNSVFTLILMGGLTFIYGIEGTLLSIVITPGLLFLCTFILFYKKITKYIRAFKFKIRKDELVKLSSFLLMTIAATIIGGILETLLRTLIIYKVNLESAGLWDALNKLSSYYMLFISSSLGFYFLPKLSSTKTNKKTVTILFKGILFTLSVSLAMTVFICFLDSYIIKYAFSNSFSSIKEFFPLQFSTDIIRSLNWLLAIYFISKASIKEYIFIQVLYFVLSYSLAKYFFIDEPSLSSIVKTYFLSNLILFAYILFRVIFSLKSNLKRDVVYHE